MIPKKIHFIFGLSSDFGGYSFAMYHYMAILSAKVINKGYDIILHYYHEPPGEWWPKAKQIAMAVKLPSDYAVINGREIKKHAHRSDWLRLEILKQEGGIYLDIDTICINPYDPLLNFKEGFVMGVEMFAGRINGLCNAVILSEPDHQFLKLWQAHFDTFDQEDYNYFAVRLPIQIRNKNPQLAYILPPEAFFRLNWTEDDMKTMYEQTIAFDRSYSLHLLHYSSHWWLDKVSLDDIMTKDTSYNLLARKVLNEARSQSIL